MVIGYGLALLVLACTAALAPTGGGAFAIDRARASPGPRR